MIPHDPNANVTMRQGTERDGHFVSDGDYLLIMLAKLIDALLRKDGPQDGNWGYPGFHDELRQMQKSLDETSALKRYPKTMVGL